MTEKAKHNLRKGVGIFLSVWTVLVGIAFIVQVWRIYAIGGEERFTAHSISTHFRQIAIPFYIWIAAIAAAGVLWLVFPAAKQKITPYVDVKCTLARLNRRLTESGEGAKRAQTYRLVAKCVCALACLGCMIAALVYLIADVSLSAKSGFLAEHKEAERILRALVWIVAATALGIGTAYFVEDSYKKEIALAKSAIAENAKKGVKVQKREEKVTLRSIAAKKFAFVQSKWFIFGLRIAVAVVAVTFVIIGVSNGGMKAMLQKAINICTQCIGIG